MKNDFNDIISNLNWSEPISLYAAFISICLAFVKPLWVKLVLIGSVVMGWLIFKEFYNVVIVIAFIICFIHLILYNTKQKYRNIVDTIQTEQQIEINDKSTT